MVVPQSGISTSPENCYAQVTALPGNPGISLLFQKLETCGHRRSCVSVWGELNACSRSKQDVAMEEELFWWPFPRQGNAQVRMGLLVLGPESLQMKP